MQALREQLVRIDANPEATPTSAFAAQVKAKQQQDKEQKDDEATKGFSKEQTDKYIAGLKGDRTKAKSRIKELEEQVKQLKDKLKRTKSNRVRETNDEDDESDGKSKQKKKNERKVEQRSLPAGSRGKNVMANFAGISDSSDSSDDSE